MPVSASQTLSTAENATATASSQLQSSAGETRPDPRTLRCPETFQSLDNIDLAIFGSVAGMDSSDRVGGRGRQVPMTSQCRTGSNHGVVLDAAAVFSGPRSPTRLVIPRFRPRTHRGHVFDPTAVLQRVDELSLDRTNCDRGKIFTRL